MDVQSMAEVERNQDIQAPNFGLHGHTHTYIITHTYNYIYIYIFIIFTNVFSWGEHAQECNNSQTIPILVGKPADTFGGILGLPR
jgi:hypothetical protein